MTDITFHFNVPDKISYACRLIRTAVNRGARVRVAGDDAALRQLDAMLWTFSPLEFIPHCLAGEAAASVLQASPVVLGGVDQPGLHREVLLNLGPAMVPGFEQFQRLNELVSQDEADRLLARDRWRQLAASGYQIKRHEVTDQQS
jgi:DNA polymerase III subunit chi